MAQSAGEGIVYDLYTGTGTIANFVAARARQVIGIEYVPEAIADAKVNAALNGLTDKTLFYAGDMKDILTDDFIRSHGHPDVIITDPRVPVCTPTWCRLSSMPPHGASSM